MTAKYFCDDCKVECSRACGEISRKIGERTAQLRVGRTLGSTLLTYETQLCNACLAKVAHALADGLDKLAGAK